MTDKPTIVWVLGAGFSRSLGGPLLPELLTTAAREQCKIQFPLEQFPQLHTEEVLWVHRLYQFGRRYFDGYAHPPDEMYADQAQQIWSDAEEFIDYLDTAANRVDSPGAQRLLSIAGKLSGKPIALNIPRLRIAAKRMLAAECSAFLQYADTQSERWEPYREWIRELGQDDFILTFNYDLVLETLREVEVVTSKTNLDRADEAKVPKVIKLHGSVDWTRDKSGALKRSGNRFHALSCMEGELAIATPGPSKQTVTAELQNLWDIAAAILAKAHAIVFIGYRFPPSDAQARSRLLKALIWNKAPVLHLHVVLGPDLAKPDPVRLLGLLEYATRGRTHVTKFHTHPLYAEDFLSVWNRNQLLAD